MWSGHFLPRPLAATGGGDDIDVELPQEIKELRITAYNATAARGTISVYFRRSGNSYLIGAYTPTTALDPLQVVHAGRVPREVNIRVTFAGTVASDALQVNLSYELQNGGNE